MRIPLREVVFLLLALSVIGITTPAAHAANDVSVTGELSRQEVDAGEMAELQVRVTGAEVADVPREISVEGLQIRLTGQSTQVQMVNFKISSSVVYSYVVMPLRTGKFTIPAIPVRTTAGLLRTSPLSFSVLDGSGGSQPQNSTVQPGMPGFSQPQVSSPRPASSPPDAGRLAFGEITCPKKTIYAGEMVPVDISYFFDARYPVKVRGRVDFGSEGVIVERFPDPKESREDRDGITYNVLSFHTLLSAVKPGAIDIDPAKLECQIQMPGALPPGFDDPVFRQVLGSQNPFTESRDVTVKTAPLHLEILPLPKEGRPASFAGAVGEFDIDAMVANAKPAPGDPAVLTIKIGGKGNFSAMGAPVLTGTEGWRTYPPTEKFEGSGELSNSGVKSFDFTLIAQEPKTSSPGTEFSYFDPVTAKYEVLTTKPLPLAASPGSVPAEATLSAANTAPSQTPLQTATPAAKLSAPYQERGPLPVITFHSWKTPVEHPEFLIANLAMLMATASLAGILRYYYIQRAGGTPASRRRRRSRELMSLLKSETLDAAATYAAALEYLTLIPAGKELRDSMIEAFTARRDVLKYGSVRSVALSREEKGKLLESLGKITSAPSR